jgi:hypothetical protein
MVDVGELELFWNFARDLVGAVRRLILTPGPAGLDISVTLTTHS